jgi:hypothetical protein
MSLDCFAVEVLVFMLYAPSMPKAVPSERPFRARNDDSPDASPGRYAAVWQEQAAVSRARDWRGAEQPARSDGRSDSRAPQSPTPRSGVAPKTQKDIASTHKLPKHTDDLPAFLPSLTPWLSLRDTLRHPYLLSPLPWALLDLWTAVR